MVSGSLDLQSSSGGEEEYDSRGETFLRHLDLVSPSSSSTSQQGQFLSHSGLLFDHNFHQSLALTPLNSQYNNDNNVLVWPLGGMGLRSQPNNYGSLSSHHQPLLEQPLVETTSVVGRSTHSLPSDQPPPPPKNPKKRTRASRRAPTTVLTTDTTNFRQMVQEFTGIPADPFSGCGGGGGGSLYSRRLDLFSTAGSSALGAFHHHPSTQKVHDLSVHKLSGQGLGINNSTFCHKKSEMPSFIPSSSNTNFQLTKQQSSAFFSTEDQILTFQPLLQSSLNRNPLGNHEPNEPVFGSKSRGSNTHLSAIDGLGISHEQATASLSGFLGQGSANNNSDQARNCSTSSALELHPHDKGLENGVCSGGDGDAASSWPCPN